MLNFDMNELTEFLLITYLNFLSFSDTIFPPKCENVLFDISLFFKIEKYTSSTFDSSSQFSKYFIISKIIFVRLTLSANWTSLIIYVSFSLKTSKKPTISELRYTR